MTFKTQLADDLDVFYNTNEYAVTATYRPTIATPDVEGIVVLIEEGQGDESQGADSFGVSALLRVRKHDVPMWFTVYRGGFDAIDDLDAVDDLDGIQWVGKPQEMNPVAGDRFITESDTWQVLGAKKSACGLEWICNVHRLTR